MKKFQLASWTILLILGGLSWGEAVHGAGNHTNQFPSDFDRLKTILQQPHSLSAATPEWLKMEVEHRTRYETFNHSFRKDQTGSNQQLALRTRMYFQVHDILDPFNLTFELADFRAPVSDRGQDSSPFFVNHFDIFQLHLDWLSQNFLGTGLTSKIEVGRLVMDFGKGRLVAGYRFGSFTPTFDGVQLTLGSNINQAWGFRAFGTRPVQQHTVSPDWNTPSTYFSGAAMSSRHVPWANGELYFFQLNEGNHLRKRDLSTIGFRVFAEPVREQLNYEIESIYQVGEVDRTNHFAHRHHGEIGYSFGTDWPLQVVYLFDYSSGDPNRRKNFDFLFAKRRAEYGPTGIFGVIFPSNILAPVGFRSTLQPTSAVRLMVSHRTFWLADGRGPFVGSGLQDPSGRAGTFLGNLFDTSVNWAPQDGYFRHTSFEVGFARFFKGSYFDRVPSSPSQKDVDYVYSMVTLRL